MFEIDFELNDGLRLESGETIRPLRLRCSIYGKLNYDKSNAVLVYHALSGSSRINEWWEGVLGKGLALDTSKHAFVCVNYPGSCYGSTSSREIKKKTGKIPLITAKDVVYANSRLWEFLGIKRFKRAVGASIGGMLALRQAVDFPESVDEVVAIGAAPLTPLGLALNHLQRQAAEKGDLGLARKIALLTYKSSALLEDRFGRSPNRNGEEPFRNQEDRFDVAGYLDHKAKEFEARFERESYLSITKMMDLFELNSDEISRIGAEVRLVGISSDWLFPADSIRGFHRSLTKNGIRASYSEITTEEGHDAFLSEPALVNVLFSQFEKSADRRAAA